MKRKNFLKISQSYQSMALDLQFQEIHTILERFVR